MNDRWRERILQGQRVEVLDEGIRTYDPGTGWEWMHWDSGSRSGAHHRAPIDFSEPCCFVTELAERREINRQLEEFRQLPMREQLKIHCRDFWQEIRRQLERGWQGGRLRRTVSIFLWTLVPTAVIIPALSHLLPGSDILVRPAIGTALVLSLILAFSLSSNKSQS
jgi:hypothetical protein